MNKDVQLLIALGASAIGVVALNAALFLRRSSSNKKQRVLAAAEVPRTKVSCKIVCLLQGKVGPWMQYCKELGPFVAQSAPGTCSQAGPGLQAPTSHQPALHPKSMLFR